MLNLLLRLAVTVLALRGADILLPNLNFPGGWGWLIGFGVILGLVNWSVKPILVFFSVPFLVLSLGVFYFVVNSLVLYMASMLYPGSMHATNAGILLGSTVISFFHWVISLAFRLSGKQDE